VNHVSMCEKSHIKLSVFVKYWRIMQNTILGGLITALILTPKQSQKNIIFVIEIFHLCSQNFLPHGQIIFVYMARILYTCSKKNSKIFHHAHNNHVSMFIAHTIVMLFMYLLWYLGR